MVIVTNLNRAKTVWRARHQQIAGLQNAVLRDKLELLLDLVVHVASDIFLFHNSIDLQFEFDFVRIRNLFFWDEIRHHQEVVSHL